MRFLRFLSCLSPTQKKWYSSCFRSRKALCFVVRLIICNSLNCYSDFVSLFQCPFLKGAYSHPQARSGLGICSLIVCSFLSPHLSKFVVIYFSLSFFFSVNFLSHHESEGSLRQAPSLFWSPLVLYIEATH